jgi:hypothetical protein
VPPSGLEVHTAPSVADTLQTGNAPEHAVLALATNPSTQELGAFSQQSQAGLPPSHAGTRFGVATHFAAPLTMEQYGLTSLQA